MSQHLHYIKNKFLKRKTKPPETLTIVRKLSLLLLSHKASITLNVQYHHNKPSFPPRYKFWDRNRGNLYKNLLIFIPD